MLARLLGKKTAEVLDSINGINLSPEDVVKLGNVVHDYSPIHRDVEVAQQFGFVERPVIGVHLASIGGRIARNLLAVMQQSEWQFTSQDVTFRDPVYPGEPINWQIGEEAVEEESRRYSLIIPSPEQDKKPRVEMIATFSPKWPEFKQPERNNLIYRDEIKFAVPETREFYECLREQPKAEVLFSYAAARKPSTLLTMVGELNRINNTNIGGKNIQMINHAHGDLQLGNATVEVYANEIKGRGNKVFYTFDMVLYQNEQPKVSSWIKTLANGLVDVTALKDKFR